MRLFTITALAITTCGSVCGELKSPDGHYQIEYIKALQGESNVRFKNLKTGKILGLFSSNAYEHSAYLDTAWSPDSRYLAVVHRGTRTTAEIEVFSFSGDSVEEVKLPDYRLNLLGRQKLVSGGRYHWASKLRWNKSTLTFYCTGQWVDGSGDPQVKPENWYHFDVSLQLGVVGSASNPRLTSVVVSPPIKLEDK